jgi:hypothetical protein
MATCFDCTESSSSLPKNISGRPDDDSIHSKHVAVRIFCFNKLLCLTEIYTVCEFTFPDLTVILH